jgi:putative sporulation protein YtaF
MGWLSTLLLALAVSLDSLGVGFAYGVKKMRVPASSLITISTVSALGMLSSMLLGRSLCSFLGNKCSMMGSMLLITMGLISLGTTWKTKPGYKKKTDEPVCNTPPFEIISRIVQEPITADLDQSGEINISEALLLGLALALDSLGAGLGAALTAYRLAITSGLVGLLNMLTLVLGHRMGQIVNLSPNSWANFAPGILLVLLGTWQLV